MAQDYATHRENRNISQGYKKADRLEAAENVLGLCVASFDMQKILTMPRSEVSVYYYKNKVSLMNFTIFDMGPKLGLNHIWNETMAKKSSSEVATCVFKFIEKKCLSNPEMKVFKFYSDNPTSQNKNRFMFAMYRFASSKFNVKITHRFLEVGHTHMEVDNMHGNIERSAKGKEIFDESEWCRTIKNAKKNPDEEYTIVKLGEDWQVLDFKPLVNAQNWKTDAQKKNIKWTKVREIVFDPATPQTVSLKYDYKGDFITLNVSKRGRPVNFKTYQPPSAYLSRFPLPENKVADLKSLMKSGAIPTKYHSFYEELINIGEGTDPGQQENVCGEGCLCCEDMEEEEVNEEGLDQD